MAHVGYNNRGRTRRLETIAKRNGKQALDARLVVVFGGLAPFVSHTGGHRVVRCGSGRGHA